MKPFKGLICYYSGSGNTTLACEYIKKKVTNVNFELHNIVKADVPTLDEYDVVGFATFSDFGDIPPLFHTFFEKLALYPEKPVFVFNTFGLLSGKTLKILEKKATEKQLNVIAGYSLHTPESYIPMRARNMTYDDSPNQKEVNEFNSFIEKLDGLLGKVQAGEKLSKAKISVGILNSIISAIPRAKDKKDMGIQNVDELLCGKCKTCEKSCPYEAIHLDPFPVFDHDKCQGCWACYNHCSNKAIYTKKFKGKGHYPKPSEQLLIKLQ